MIGNGENRTRRLDEYVQAFLLLGGEASLFEVARVVEQKARRPLAADWEAGIRARIYEHSSDSEHFEGGEDIFRQVGSKGSGVWAVRTEWLQAKGLVPRHHGTGRSENVPELLVAKRLAETESDYEIVKNTVYGYKRNRQRALLLRNLYNHSCQVCGLSIKTKTDGYAEVHHVKPRNRFDGPDLTANMIVVCPNHHREVDLGVLCIEPESHRILHHFNERLHHSELALLKHELDDECLRFAMENIYDSAATPVL